jgi:hypothetical protein
VCPNTDPSGIIGFSISILYIDDYTYNTTTKIDGLISAFLVRLFEWIDEFKLSPTPTPEDDE